MKLLKGLKWDFYVPFVLFIGFVAYGLYSWLEGGQYCFYFGLICGACLCLFQYLENRGVLK